MIIDVGDSRLNGGDYGLEIVQSGILCVPYPTGSRMIA